MNATKDIIRLIKIAKKAGNLISNQEATQIITALGDIARDKKKIEKIIVILSTTTNQTHSLKKLSSRENQIFNLIALGLTSKEIAALLDISLETVSTHRKNMIKKLNIKGSGHLYKYAYDCLQNM